MIRHHATVAPMAPAVDFGGRSMTYADLDRIADRIAATLAAMGLAPGDRVLWLGKNNDGFARIVAGVARARMVLVPINWRLTRPEVRFIADHSGPAPALASAAFPPDCTAAPAGTGKTRKTAGWGKGG